MQVLRAECGGARAKLPVAEQDGTEVQGFVLKHCRSVVGSEGCTAMVTPTPPAT